MKERQALKEDLEVTKTALVNTQRLKNDLDADVSQLREKVTELSLREDDRAAGTQFTCFTSTKVQMLTQRAVDARGRPRRRYSVYLLYWYKSTNADTESCRCARTTAPQVRSVLALLVQEYKCWHPRSCSAPQSTRTS
jgi:hypothetical protein